MNQLQERIAQFRKMANDDPDNELGHYRLGQLLMEDKQFGEAIHSFRRTLELSPQFSKVYQLLGQCLTSAGQQEEAIVTLQHGFAVADERGDNMPRDEMSRMLVQLGQSAPVPRSAEPKPDLLVGPGTSGFRCGRTMCVAGGHARQLPAPPMKDDIGRKIHETICADCWNDWVKNQSIKVINELRLDLSTERGTEEYDRYMKEFFGLE
jgi:Fe-S cluster biosynthesis and repair protein YggX